MMAHRSKSFPAWTKMLAAVVSLVTLVQLSCLVGNPKLAVALTLDRSLSSSRSLLEANVDIPSDSFQEDEEQEDPKYDELSEEPLQYALAQDDQQHYEDYGHEGHQGGYDEQQYQGSESEDGYDPQAHYEEEGAYEEHQQGGEHLQAAAAASHLVHPGDNTIESVSEGAAAVPEKKGKGKLKAAKAKVRGAWKRLGKTRVVKAVRSAVKKLRKEKKLERRGGKRRGSQAHLVEEEPAAEQSGAGHV